MNISFDAYEVNELSEFMSVLSEIQAYFCDSRAPDNFLFRGEPQNNLSLIPSIFRCYPKDRMNESCGVRGLMYAPDKEIDILFNFIREAAYKFPHLNTNDYIRWMTIAQHHGAPTRLLDLTSNPLVALFFSCVSLEKNDGVVWVFNTYNYHQWLRNDLNLNSNERLTQELLESCVIKDFIEENDSESLSNILTRPYIMYPSVLDERMAAQKSRFLVWASDHRGLEEMIDNDTFLFGKTKTSQRIYENGNPPRGFLGKIIIPYKQKERILRELNIISINQYTLFPGLDGLGRYLKESKEHSPLDITWF